MTPPLLRRREFRTFWVGQSISMLGDQVTVFALPITAVLLLHAGPEQMGLLTAAGIVPSLLFSLHAGVWVDRRGQRRRIMLASDVTRALLVLSVPAAYLGGLLTLTQLYAVALAVGTADVFFAVAYQSLFVSIVAEEDYLSGQALLNGSRAMSAVIGQGVAGTLIAAVTAPGALALDAFSFLASAVSLRRIRPREAPTQRAERGGLTEGLRFIAGSPTLRAALASTTTVNFFTFAFSAIFILYATRGLHVHPLTLGVVLGAGAIGGILGSLLTGRVARRIGVGRAYALGSLAFPAPLALVPAAGGPHWLVLGCLFGAEFGSGLGVMMLDISIGAIFAIEIPHRMRSRVSGAYRTVNYGVRPLGAVVGGALGGALGLPVTLWIAVVGACTCVLWLLGSPLLDASHSASSAPASSLA